MRLQAYANRRAAAAMLASALPLTAVLIAEQAEAAQPPPLSMTRAPFTATLSNVSPLAFGMDVGETSRVLAQPLIYLEGTPGNETFLALRDLGGSGLVPHHHRLFLKFRKGRLTGWKEDYGTNWMWR
ncbi:conserved hypothetical protein [Bradyrhizobium sp. ORS 285]|uniref:hypothetical protein n=1 Tax=Bradyrhizobium sp. ORS 285 TaxID=115808 RepID=UPI0002407863|nr:hypothetical protein [Bradyrhizobium sp. ORS 285]CCD84981.1 conserved exported hypothetical protein [Bradyrhizobium sp. ORS 285]SMX62255.1 conserved hypothetical protein [Bradyrhizobium sp. ORS 285]